MLEDSMLLPAPDVAQPFIPNLLPSILIPTLTTMPIADPSDATKSERITSPE
jgi:hypothetical protein